MPQRTPASVKHIQRTLASGFACRKFARTLDLPGTALRHQCQAIKPADRGRYEILALARLCPERLESCFEARLSLSPASLRGESGCLKDRAIGFDESAFRIVRPQWFQQRVQFLRLSR